jgi:enterochelin esterase-like enzyme
MVFWVGIGIWFQVPAWLLAQAPVPAAPPNGYDHRREEGAHGKLDTLEYPSKTVGNQRKMVIYTPPDYQKEVAYPVLYLLHGAGDDETGWQKKGAAAVILDNLYAEKKIVPMIVVMPNGFARPDGATRPSGFGPGSIIASAVMHRADTNKDGKVTLEEFLAASKEFFKECDKNQKGTLDEKQLADGINRAMMASVGPGARPGGMRGMGGNAFEADLLKDIIPFVEAHYKVQSGGDHRAIAGLSMGGGQALTIGLNHLDQFGWIGGFSAAPMANPLSAPDASASKKLHLLWLSCGEKDRLLETCKKFHSSLEEKKIPHIYHIEAGGHEWPVWRRDLYLLAQMLFRDQ